jgi:hypothetical protein
MMNNKWDGRQGDKGMKGIEEWKDKDKNDNRMNNKTNVKEYRRNISLECLIKTMKTAVRTGSSLADMRKVIIVKIVLSLPCQHRI